MVGVAVVGVLVGVALGMAFGTQSSHTQFFRNRKVSDLQKWHAPKKSHNLTQAALLPL